MRATLAGEGALEGLARGGVGRVLAWFSRAVYLRLTDAVIALVDPAVPPGPIHLSLDHAVPETVPGAEVVVRGDRLLLDDSTIDLRGLRTWRGAYPDPALLRGSAPLLTAVLADLAAGSALTSPPFSSRADEARLRIEVGDLAGAAQLLGGLGPGLTPAGDDALGALLFVHRVLEGDPVAATLSEVARRVRTGDISLAFLRWAARGQVLAPGHDLVLAAERGDRAAAEGAARALGEVGETSGADFALGLTWALQPSG